MNLKRWVACLRLSGHLTKYKLCFSRTVLCSIVTAGLLLTLCSSAAVGQEFFTVRNQKKQKWPEAEANRLYLLASQAVEREFKLTRSVRPRFTLVLGFEGNQLDVNTGELRMAKWDRRIFADGVILFCMEQMLTPDTRLQLLRRTLLAAESVVDVDEKVARSEHMETPASATPGATHADNKP
jgi:hypothetical protein